MPAAETAGGLVTRGAKAIDGAINTAQEYSRRFGGWLADNYKGAKNPKPKPNQQTNSAKSFRPSGQMRRSRRNKK